MADFVEPSWVKNAKQTIGTGVEPVYEKKLGGHGGDTLMDDLSKPPIGYRYDNGKSQYVYLDLAGKPTGTVENRGSGIGSQLLSMGQTLAPIGLTALGANFLAPALGDLFGADVFGGGGVAEGLTGAGGAGTSINEMIASGLTPGSVGAAGAAAGALTPAELAAAAGTAGTALAAPAVTSLNEMIASGMAPGAAGAAGAATGALTPAELAAASGVGATSLADISALSPTATPGTPPPPNVGPPGTNVPPVVPPVAPQVEPVVPPTATPGTPPPPDVGTPGTNIPTTVPPGILDTIKNLTGLNGTQLATLLTGLTGVGNAANLTSAINTGLDATTAANTASQGVLKDIYNQQLGFQAPYQATGVSGLNQINKLADTGYLTHQFNAQDLAAGLAPNYDFMLQQGQMANQRAANVGGGALSGNTLQGLQNYTQNYAGNAYQNAFNNYQTQRGNIYNNLANMAGIGQTANQGAQAAGAAYGKGTTDLNTALANAQAAAAIGKAQALGQGTTGLANSTFLSSLLGQNTSPAATNNAGNVLSSLTGGAGNFLSSLFGNNTTTSGNLPI